MQVSAVIPVKNEATDLPRLIKSLAFADEVIIVDTGSTDNSIEIALEHGAKVIREDFIDFSQIRNYGSQLAKNDWILALDADNEVPPALAHQIIALPDTPAAYKIGRINYIWGKPILHADWGPADDCHIRLYHRSNGQWSSQIHEQFQTTLPVKTLSAPLNHYNYTTISEFIDKLNRYSDLEARRRHTQKQTASLLRLFGEPLYDFGKRYFYKLGFLEGLHGFYLCILQAIYYLTVNIKLYQLTVKA